MSKNNQHRFKDINATNKSCRAYALRRSDRGVVKILDTYLPLLPPNSPYFYMQVLDSFPSDPCKSCVRKQRIGVNSLKNMLPELSRKCGVGVRYTNHSLRATAITRMFNSGLPEKVISGHRSTKALRFYERTSTEQRQAVTTSISPTTDIPDLKDTVIPDSKDTVIPESNDTVIPESKDAVTHQAFSGTFSNCTFHI